MVGLGASRDGTGGLCLFCSSSSSRCLGLFGSNRLQPRLLDLGGSFLGAGFNGAGLRFLCVALAVDDNEKDRGQQQHQNTAANDGNDGPMGLLTWQIQTGQHDLVAHQICISRTITLRSLFAFAQARSVRRTRFLLAASRKKKKRSTARRIRYCLTANAVAHYVDLHSHLLPDLDDGADSLDTCLAMVRALAEIGFSDLCATPHQFAGRFQPALDQVRLVFDQVSREIATVLPDIRLLLGAENYWDDVLAGRMRQGEIPCYDGGKAFLFEVSPAVMPPRLEEALFDIRVSGRLAVMAHPERYAAVQRDPTLAERLGRQAALLVDLAALSGTGARAEVKTARRLVEEGLVHAVASDLHAPEDAPTVAGGVAWIEKRLGADVVKQLLSDNPRRILLGQLP